MLATMRLALPMRRVCIWLRVPPLSTAAARLVVGFGGWGCDPLTFERRTALS